MVFRSWQVDPWREFERLQREMNRLFDSFTGSRRRVYPAVNIYSNQDGVVVTAELPGYDPKDVDISVLGEVLTLRGVRKPVELGQEDKFHRQERSHGEFERSIRLPFAVDADKVQAEFKNGVLNIVLPRAEADKPKKIHIKTN
ncbi:MAG: Hsp20/alpha crystallin family protein [Calditrichaeota bacterium]|nr:MAG: Hsp20/alpha crystallin family protein [Calditrichota bacterium]